MIAPAPPSLVWPLLSAAVLAALPARAGSRRLPVVAVVAAAGTLALALWAVLSSPVAASGLWLQDRLARSAPAPLAVPALLAACASLGADLASGVAVLRRRLVAAQLLTAGAVAACRADPLFAMLAGFALMAVAATMLVPAPDRPHRLAWMAALLLTAWTGAALLSCGLGIPAGWTGLAAATGPAALRLFGLLLLLLPMLLLAWLGGWPTAADDRSGATGSTALTLPLLGLPALVVALRLRGLPSSDPLVLHAAATALVGGGVAMLLLSLLPAASRQGLERRVARMATIQLGAAAIGFGVGGTSGVSAGLLLLAFLAVALPASLLSVPTPAGRVLRRLAVLSLAGLPPFGPFAAAFMLLLRLFADRLLLALLVLLALGAGAASLLPARAEPDATPGPAGRAALLPGAVALALLFWLGLAMPASLSDWLLGVAESMTGSMTGLAPGSP